MKKKAKHSKLSFLTKLLVGIGIILIGAVAGGTIVYIKTKPPTPEFHIPTLTESNGRIIYGKDNKIISVDSNGKNPIELDVKGEELTLSKNGKILYYILENDVWKIATDGTSQQKILDNPPIPPNPYTTTYLHFSALNNSGNILLFKDSRGYYSSSQEKAQQKPEHTEPFGVYVYNDLTGLIRKIGNLGDNEDQSGYVIYNFIETDSENLIYAHPKNGHLYALIPTNESIQISKVPLPYISAESSFIDPEKREIIYVARSSAGNYSDGSFTSESSQIVQANYKTGKKTPITPVGGHTTYQQISISPNGQNVIWQQQENYFSYNTSTRKTTKLSIPYTIYPYWISDEEFIYKENEGRGFKPGNTYKFNLNTNQSTIFIENVDSLIIPPPTYGR